MINSKRIYDNLKRLIEVPSVSGTEAEAAGIDKILELLYEIPYFAENKDHVEKVDLIDDPLNRSIVGAFLQIHPESPETVILSGHYDVVDIQEYGHLQDIAYNVEEITKRITEMPVDEDTLRDYNSGEWIFGRGTADMKFGHALAIEILRYYSENPDEIKGNLLYVPVCGEETNSEGMLRAVPYFNELRRRYNLHYKAFLLSECYLMEDQANDHNRYIHYGSSGKVMPMYFFAGESTHGGEPFLGIDPTLISTEVYKRLHMNTSFCETSHGATTPPPVCLKMEDLKETYSVSIPLYSVAYYNLITVSLDPKALTEKLKQIGYDAMKDAIKFMEEKTAEFDKITGEKTVTYKYEPCVMTYKELVDEIRKDYKGDLDADLKAFAIEERKKNPVLQDVAVSLIKHTYELYKNKRPAVILAYIPPYYPDSYMSPENEEVKLLLEGCQDVIKYAKEKHGETVKMKNWYMGISDMCYTGLQEGKDYDSLFENLAGIGSIYQFPAEDIKEFAVPGIVLGGYGKDFHKHTERLHKHYSFDVVPDLYLKLINKLMN